MLNPHIGIDRDKYFTLNERLIHNTIKKHRKRASQLGIDYDDLLQHGSIGFLKAYDRYDPTKFENVNSFSTYAVPMIKGEVMRLLRDANPGIKYSRSIKSAFYDIVRNHLEEETPGYISEMLGISLYDAQEALAYGRNHNPLRLDAPIESQDGEKITYLDRVASTQDFSSANITEFVETLTEKQKSILSLRMKDVRQTDIGTNIGMSQVHVSRTLKKIGELYEYYLKGEKPPERRRKKMNKVQSREEMTQKAIELLKTTTLPYRTVAEQSGVSYKEVTKLGPIHRPAEVRLMNKLANKPEGKLSRVAGDRQKAIELLKEGKLSYGEITRITGVPAGSMTKLKEAAGIRGLYNARFPGKSGIPSQKEESNEEVVEEVILPTVIEEKAEEKQIKRIGLRKTIDFEMEGNDVALENFFQELDQLKQMVVAVGTANVSFTIGVNAKGE